MSRVLVSVVVLVGLSVLAACDLVDPMRPSPQADSETFGNLLEAAPDPARPETWVAKIRVGVPRALGRVDDARPTPNVEDGIIAVVAITAETVVLVDDRPVPLMDIGPGTEVVAIPSPGTTTMYGEKEIHLEADYVMDFVTYARWKMPKLELAGGPEIAKEDPAAVNSSGVETAPIPLGDGSVLYFTARLRPPVVRGSLWVGAKRVGLSAPEEGGRSADSSFRTEIGADGWSAPELVQFPGMDETEGYKVTWVSDDELSCYLTVVDRAGNPWIATSRREAVTEPWGDLERMETTGDGDAYDAVALTGAVEKTVFGTTRSGGGDIYLHDAALGPAQPLQPEINTAGLEWAPRVGPAGELYFVRGDHQLRFQSGRVGEVRLPGPHRALIVEAAPSPDGRWLFFASPKLRPIEFDFDILVAPIADDGSLGEAVPVDDWRPH
jgi:hypothetical protein